MKTRGAGWARPRPRRPAWPRQRVMSVAAARAGANHRVRKAPIRSPRLRSGSPDGFHSRSRRCETSIRQSRAQDGIQAEKRLVRQAHERKGGLGEAPAGGTQDDGQVLTEKDVGRLLKPIQDGGHHRGNQDDPEHREGPEPGRRQESPAQQQ